MDCLSWYWPNGRDADAVWLEGNYRHGGRWWQPATRFMAITCRLTALETGVISSQTAYIS